jgi:hypothetical protein
MSLWRVRVLLVVVALVSAIGVSGIGLSARLAGQSAASSSRSDTEWRFFGGDAGATRYSPASSPANLAEIRFGLELLKPGPLKQRAMA